LSAFAFILGEAVGKDFYYLPFYLGYFIKNIIIFKELDYLYDSNFSDYFNNIGCYFNDTGWDVYNIFWYTKVYVCESQKYKESSLNIIIFKELDFICMIQTLIIL